MIWFKVMRINRPCTLPLQASGDTALIYNISSAYAHLEQIFFSFCGLWWFGIFCFVCKHCSVVRSCPKVFFLVALLLYNQSMIFRRVKYGFFRKGHISLKQLTYWMFFVVVIKTFIKTSYDISVLKLFKLYSQSIYYSSFC